jgi:2',3'-cyclic-nucleotide 2'-phosphodiesterase (5'-nucleotidase family)
MQLKALFLFALLLATSLFVPALCFPEQAHSKSVTLLFGDTLNGTVEPCPSCDGGSPLGGLARRGAWVQSTRETRKGSLLLDPGDAFFDRYRKAIPAENVTAQSDKAHLILNCYNLLGYDALGIGDDDLSLGKDFLADLSKRADFPFICSNLVDKDTGQAIFRTEVIKEAGGLRVAIFSLLSPNFFSDALDSRTKGIALSEPLEEARNVLSRIRPRADVVVLLSHLGYTADIELAETLPGIDVILGGRSGRSLSYPVRIKDTIIVQLGSKGLHVGELLFQLPPDRSSRPDSALKAAIPLSYSDKEHPEIAEMVRAYKRKHSPEWFKADEVCAEE